ncbi:intermembrane transport protein PqiA [Microbulbifer aestuariivivens]|uniref:Intermembrane transport protein PqiA n=1 Tax=Microbulbifer aestuariivivens TaxID=1908308 RepID=A0ABP9WRV5_9GAMM
MSRAENALAHGLCTCLCCHQLQRLPAGAFRGRCHRCGATVYGRIEGSLMLTWALVLTAAFLLVPANILPVMTVIYLGSGEPSTILGGTLELYRNDLWGIALLVFIASIAVPVMKLLGLVVLLLQVQWRGPRSPLQSMRIYRVVAAIGRWSLLDLFMISILVALVNLGAVAEVRAGPGSTAFATVVVVTMLAARTFDPRLLWDARYRRMGASGDD